MAEPADKSPAINRVLDSISREFYGRDRTKSINADRCVACGGPANSFNNELSRQEYTISGLCQTCQDWTFFPEGEEDLL